MRYGNHLLYPQWIAAVVAVESSFLSPQYRLQCDEQSHHNHT